MGTQNYVSHHAWRCNKRAFRSQLRWWIGRHFIFIFVSSMNHVAHLLPAQRREGTAAKMSRLKLWSLGSLGPTKTGCGNWSKGHQNHTICQVKGQLISKWFLGSSISSKKRTNEFVFTTMRIVFVRFLEEIDDLKKPFRN